jgi:cysteine desulfurase
MSAHLDAAAGAPLHPVAREALLAALDDGWADPGRLYGSARRAAMLLQAATEAAAEAIGARPDELVFTANGTQALHAAVLGTLAGNQRARGFVHSAVEHSAVLHAAEAHMAAGGTATSIGVDSLGRVDVEAFITASRGVAAAALQAANHEVGTAQPVAEVAAALTAPLIVDATQALGHAVVPDGWSILAGDARAWGGPDVGLLVVRTGTRWRSPYPEDDRGPIPGVPNIPAIVAAVASLRAVSAERDEVATRHRTLIDRIRAAAAQIPDVDVLGDPVDRLPHITTFSCLYVDGEALLHRLDKLGFAVSSGSSCTASTLEPSHVLVAMGALTSGNIRVSLHRDTTEHDIEAFLAVLPGAIADVRDELGAAGL